MKKLIASIMAVVVAAGCMSACGNSTKQSSSGEKTNISFSFWEPGTSREFETCLKKIKASYEELHPDVNIELISQPVDGYQEWIKAQMVADSIPDIEVNHANVLEEQYKAGYVVDISDDFNSENPYADNAVWKDCFGEGILAQAHCYKYEPSYAVPFFASGLSMFYNKTLYDELNLEVPTTWKEFIANCEAIKNADKTPVAFMAQKQDAKTWLCWELEIGLFGKKLFADPNLNYNGDCSITQNEVTKSVLSGYLDYTTNTEYREMYEKYMEYYKQYLQYCPDAAGLDEAAAKTMFLSGNVGHIHTGSWDIQSLIKNENIKFEVGTFPFPTFTEEESEYAGLKLNVASVQTLAVTSNVNKEEGKKEAVVDFVKYFTSPEVHKQFVNETMQIPVIKDIDVDPIFNGFLSPGYPPFSLFERGSQKEGTSFTSLSEAVISGEKVDLNDSLFGELQKSIYREAKDNAEQNGWNSENDYGIPELYQIGGLYSSKAE